MSEWKKVRLGDEVAVITKGTTPRCEYVSKGDEGAVIFLRAENVDNGIVGGSSFKYIPEQIHCKELRRSILKEGDILITIAGAIGRVALVTPSYLPANINQAIAIIRLESAELDGFYLKYFLSSPSTQELLSSISSGQSVQANLNLQQISDLEIPLPPLPTQRKIAAVLSSLDDKIENNRKICANLEAQAQAIFKSWFVDFEPFGGKMPQGWKMGKLGDIIEVCYGKDHKALPEGNIPVFGSGGYMRSVDRCIYDEESVLIPRKGTLNNIMYVNEPFWTVDTMFYSKMRDEHVAKYVHLLLQSKNMDELNVGSAVPSMTTEILNNMEIIIPLAKTLKEFDGIASSFYAQIAHAKKESRALAATRDALLPKLMSGEIDVEKVEVA